MLPSSTSITTQISLPLSKSEFLKRGVALLRVEWAFLILLVFVVVTRFGGIGAHLPDVYNEDEILLIRGFVPQTGGLQSWLSDPMRIDSYPPFSSYLTRGTLSIYYLAGRFLGEWPDVETFYFRFLVSPSPIVLIARGLSATTSTVALLLTFFLARSWYGKGAAYVATLLVALSPTMLQFSQLAKPDSLLVLQTIVLIAIAKWIANGKSPRLYLLGGLLLGLAVTTKYNGIVGAGVLWLGHILRIRREKRSIWHSILDRRLLLLGFVALEGFALGDPIAFGRFVFLLRDPARLIAEPGLVLDSLIRTFDITRSALQLGWLGSGGAPTPIVWIGAALVAEWGLPFLMLAIGGMIYAGYRHTTADLPLLVWPVVGILWIGSVSRIPNIHYLLPMFLPLAILATRFGLEIIRQYRLPKWTTAVGVLILFSIPTLNFGQRIVNQPRADTRQLARVWIEENLPWESGIAFSYYNYADLPQLFDAQTPYLAGTTIPPSVSKLLTAYARENPNYWLIDSALPLDGPLWPSEEFEERYVDNEYVRRLLSAGIPSGSQFAQFGVDYLLLTSSEYGSYLQPNPHSDGSPLYYATELRQKVYRSILDGEDPGLELIQSFYPDETTSGPILLIYRTRDTN